MSADNEAPMPGENSAQPSSTPTAGEALRKAREALGLSRQQVADKLFLTEEIIVAIEEQSFHVKRSAAFYRGYIRNYANLVGVAPDALLEVLNDVIGEVKPTVRDMPDDLVPSRRRPRIRVGRYLIIGSGIILVAALVVAVSYWLLAPSSISTDTQESAPNSNKGKGTVSLTLPEDEVHAPDLDVESATAPQTEEVLEPNTQNHTPTHDALDVSASEEDKPRQVVMTEATLTFEFSGHCWVEVYDATGERLAIGNKKPGYRMSVTGMAPFRVILGNAGVVKIRYNDEPVALTGLKPGRRTELIIPTE